MERTPPDHSGDENSLTCQEATALLTEYLAETLPVRTAQAFAQHLRRCRDCLAYCETYRTTVHLTRTLRYTEIPPELQERLLSFLQTRGAEAAQGSPQAREARDP